MQVNPDEAVATVVQDWLRQRGHATSPEGEAVVPLVWLVAEIDRLVAEGVQLTAEQSDPYSLWGRGWSKGFAAALRILRDRLPHPGPAR